MLPSEHTDGANTPLSQSDHCPQNDLRSLAVRSLETNPAFRGRLAQGVIQIESNGDSLVLKGNVPTFHVKQLLQETLRRVEGVTQIENRVVVIAPKELEALSTRECW